MPRPVTLVAAVLAAALLLPGAGCGVPDAIQRSQSLQLAAIEQYRDEMAAYHAKVREHLSSQKRAQLDAALTASLRQAAGDDGRVAVEAAVEKTAKRLALEDAWRSELARLDGEFAQRQAAIGRAIDLAEETLDLAASYGRLATLVRNLFVRDAEARGRLAEYESERSPSDAGSRSQP